MLEDYQIQNLLDYIRDVDIVVLHGTEVDDREFSDLDTRELNDSDVVLKLNYEDDIMFFRHQFTKRNLTDCQIFLNKIVPQDTDGDEVTIMFQAKHYCIIPINDIMEKNGKQ